MTTNRTLLIALALACFATLGGALYFQHVKDMLPCPLCVIQRYAFLLVGVFALIAAFVRKPLAWLVLALASAIGGAGVVARHLYVIANPGFTCGIDPYENFLNSMPTAKIMPWMFETMGLCMGAGELIAGLSLPQWAGIGFVLSIAGLVVALVRRHK